MLPKPFPITSDRYLALYDRLIAKVRVELIDWDVELGRGPCWLFQGKWSDGKGFKKVTFDNHALYVHRAMYEVMVGPVPPLLVLDHLCRQRACCNPCHLEPVTMKVNTERGNGRWIYWQGEQDAVEAHDPREAPACHRLGAGGPQGPIHFVSGSAWAAAGAQDIAA